MDKKNIQNEAVGLIVALNAALTNIRLYPPASALIADSVGRLFDAASTVFEKTDSVAYGESEKILLVQGEPLPEKEQKKPQVRSFLDMMLDLGIRSILIEKGVTREELGGFLQAIATLTGEKESAGGLQQILDEQSVSHVKIDEKVYVEMDSEHSILSGLDIKDEDIARYILGDESVSEASVELIRELAKEPEWIARVFQAGVKEVLKETVDPQSADLSETFAGMVDALKNLSGADQKEIAQHIFGSLMKMEEAVLLSVLTQNLDAVFGEKAFERFVEGLEDEPFLHLMSQIDQAAEAVSVDAGIPEPRAGAFNRVLRFMQDTAKARGLRETGEEPADRNRGPEAGELHAGLLKKALSSLIKGEMARLPEFLVMKGLVEAVTALIIKGKKGTAGTMLARLGEGLFNEKSDIREAAARLLSKIEEKLAEAGHLEERIEISRKLSEWIKHEAEISAAFEKITGQLQGLTQTLIQQDRAVDARHILEAYHLIATGDLTKDEAIQALAANMLQNLATEDILDLLLKETSGEGSKKREADIYSLVILGTTTIERLLDRLHDSHNRSERSRIVQVITRIGKPAVGPVVERIRQGGPWYYIRNLAMLLGRIGDSSHIKSLETVLTHPDTRVQREAALAIQNVGVEEGCETLLRNLSAVDDQVKGMIISLMGTMKHQGAAPDMIRMLETRMFGKTKKSKNDILKNLCKALGQIGDRRAVPALEQVVRAKGFMGIKTYHPEVKAAAEAALKAIRQKG